MQMASSGAFGLQSARHALHRSVNNNARRNIHIPSQNTVHVSAGRRILSQSRSFLTKFFGHLTAPGLGAPRPAQYHNVARSTIQQRLTLPVRTALARPQAQFLPRPPAFPRSVAQVGHGTARNFSSARPIFQNLVQNVPVTARAFCEADIDFKQRTGKNTKLRKSSKGKERRALKVKNAQATRVPEPVAEEAAELEHYFPTAAEVTTCLHVPIAPTPTSRVPLAERPSERAPLLPMQELGSIHATHEMHSMRVSSLFSRLDAANVWDKGVICSAYSHLSAGEGLCTILKLEFVGWTKAQVRAVIGESGTGWCALEELKNTNIVPPSDGYDSDLSETSSILSGVMGDEITSSVGDLSGPSVDPSASVVLPTIDFSSSFVSAAQSAASTPPLLSRSSSELSLNLSDYDYFSDSSEGSHVLVEPPSALGFSADFVRRTAAAHAVGGEEGPMEDMF